LPLAAISLSELLIRTVSSIAAKVICLLMLMAAVGVGVAVVHGVQRMCIRQYICRRPLQSQDRSGWFGLRIVDKVGGGSPGSSNAASAAAERIVVCTCSSPCMFGGLSSR